MKNQYKFIFIIFVLGLFSFGDKAFAANIIVNDSNGSVASNGLCSLSEAILNSNENNQSGSTDCISGNGIDTITIVTDIELTDFYANGFNNSSATPFITDSVIFDGQGHTITRNSISDFRFFHASSNPVSIYLNNLVLVNGNSFAGGFLYMVDIDRLEISKVRFQDGTSSWEGGAAYINDVSNGVLMKDVIFDSNNAGIGGAVYINDADTIIREGKFINNNVSAFYGGAISFSYGSISIFDTLFDTNSGGVIYFSGGSGFSANIPVRIESSTFLNNQNVSGASVIKSESTMDLRILNTTFSGNETSDGSLISVYDQDTKINIGYTTFYGNNSLNNQGVIKLLYFAPQELNIENSIFAQNIGGECLINGLSANLVNNLSNDGTCGSVQPTGVSNSIALNGGITPTHSLSYGSNAIDNAVTNIPGLKFKCPKYDQRRIVRGFDGNNDGISACDIGAFEFNKRNLTNAVGLTSLFSKESKEVAKEVKNIKNTDQNTLKDLKSIK